MNKIGLYCKKIGCSTLYGDNGKRDCVTLLHLENSEIIEIIKFEKFNIVKVGFGDVSSRHVSKPLKGFFQKLSIPMKKKIIGFKFNKELPNVGDKITVNHLTVGQFVDIKGYSVGKGFAGAMKRHGFGGLRASHGVSVSHRSHGSTGSCQDPGHVIKGKKMAGHMGCSKVTIQNLIVMYVDPENSLIAVKGSVPGAKNSYVIVSGAVKK